MRINFKYLLIRLFVMLPLASLLLLSSYVNLIKKYLHRTYTILIQYLYTDQILLSNSSDEPPKSPLKLFFLPLFLESTNLIVRFILFYFYFFFTIVFFGSYMIEKYMTLKKFNQLVDLDFDGKFHFEEKYWKNLH